MFTKSISDLVHITQIKEVSSTLCIPRKNQYVASPGTHYGLYGDGFQAQFNILP